VTVIPGVAFSGSLDGHLRAYATADGRIIWDVDTAVEYQAVNGVKAKGGSLDGPGPVVVGGNVVCELRLWDVRRDAGECAAGVFGGWESDRPR
jgi:outer membrane protein assembly factor BamB